MSATIEYKLFLEVFLALRGFIIQLAHTRLSLRSSQGISASFCVSVVFGVSICNLHHVSIIPVRFHAVMKFISDWLLDSNLKRISQHDVCIG